jgi:predicted DNA binding CopG/RHH family protein
MTKIKKPLAIPKFKSEAEERAFWANPKTETMDYFDMTQARRYDDYASPPTKAISMRLPEPMIGQLKKLALAKSMPYQTLARSYIAAGISREQSGVPKPAAKAKKRKAG